MKRLLWMGIVLTVALWAVEVYAACTTTTYFIEGRVIICTTCCFPGGNCTVTCF